MVDIGAVCVLRPRDSNGCTSIHWVSLLTWTTQSPECIQIFFLERNDVCLVFRMIYFPICRTLSRHLKRRERPGLKSTISGRSSS